MPTRLPAFLAALLIGIASASAASINPTPATDPAFDLDKEPSSQVSVVNHFLFELEDEYPDTPSVPVNTGPVYWRHVGAAVWEQAIQSADPDNFFQVEPQGVYDLWLPEVYGDRFARIELGGQLAPGDIGEIVFRVPFPNQLGDWFQPLRTSINGDLPVDDYVALTPFSIPEPGTLGLAGLAVLGFIVQSRRARNKA